MEPGPLPPHERTWRHPSELGPTRHDVAEESGGHLAPFLFGALAVIAIAGLVVTMTPRTSSSPIALSATTLPAATVRPATTVAPAPAITVTAPRGIPTGVLLTSFSAYPHAVASGPSLTIDGTAIAASEPAATDSVLVRTDAVTYELAWGQVPLLDVPDGTVVFTVDGDLVAHVRSGDWVVLTDD